MPDRKRRRGSRDISMAGCPHSTHHCMPSSLIRTHPLVKSTLYIGPWFHCSGMREVALASNGKLSRASDNEGMMLAPLLWALHPCGEALPGLSLFVANRFRA